MLLRILLGGGKVVVEPAAKILHRHAVEWRAVSKWAFASGCAHTATLTKYFLGRPSLRGSIVHYAGSRMHRSKSADGRARHKHVLPRLPFLLGSLYGPLAYLFSGKDRASAP